MASVNPGNRNIHALTKSHLSVAKPSVKQAEADTTGSNAAAQSGRPHVVDRRKVARGSTSVLNFTPVRGTDHLWKRKPIGRIDPVVKEQANTADTTDDTKSKNVVTWLIDKIIDFSKGSGKTDKGSPGPCTRNDYECGEDEEIGGPG